MTGPAWPEVCTAFNTWSLIAANITLLRVCVGVGVCKWLLVCLHSDRICGNECGCTPAQRGGLGRAIRGEVWGREGLNHWQPLLRKREEGEEEDREMEERSKARSEGEIKMGECVRFLSRCILIFCYWVSHLSVPLSPGCYYQSLSCNHA